MRLLFIADGRSPIALNWINYFIDQGHEVHLASTYACNPVLGLASLTVVPVAFSGLKKGSINQIATETSGQANPRPRDLSTLGSVGLRTTVRQWLGPLTLRSTSRHLQELIRRLQPELVHAMRIPYEGMAAALAKPTAPLLISVWGNDFTLHANSTPLMDRLTRQALQSANALHADCRRDLRLAAEYGYPADRPSLVVPGNGGLRLGVFHPLPDDDENADRPFKVINPRGLRAYVRSDTFFQAVPRVTASYPEVRFICPTMAGQPQAERWVTELGIARYVDLLPRQSQDQMAALYQACQVCVSPSEHDGTPNTLLEAMACGCFPVAGNIESLREWITPGENGLLVDPGDPVALAQAILQALDQPELRRSASRRNLELVANQAEYGKVMARVEAFYRQILE